MDEIKKDSRFAHVLKDARFRKLPKKHVKVKVDKRFRSMFKDKQFQLKYNVDKRGRPSTLGTTENLEKYYQVSESESDNDGSVGVEVTQDEKNSISLDVKKKLKSLKVDYARGEGRILSDSSSDDESCAGSDEEELDHQWGELDKDAPLTEDVTSCLAICNMDWDRIKALDLMVLFNSFIPPGGLIHSITIYPSEFGLKRMADEEAKGPTELVEGASVDKDEDAAVQMEKLRLYQLNRLRYFYAVMELDSPATANHVYTECDGLEYESSNNRLDLRFIPHGTTFDQEPREVCKELQDMSSYKPTLFTTTALTQAKVELTWDETDPSRHDVVKSMHAGKIDDQQVRKYLACSSSEDEQEEGDVVRAPTISLDDTKDTSSEKASINKYKLLLADIEKKEKSSKEEKMNMEVKWDLKAENKIEEEVIDALRDKQAMTPFQKYLEKRKDRKKKKKLEKSAETFSDDEIPSDIDMNDPYFKEELEKQTSVKSKKTKLKNSDEVADDAETSRKACEMELLLLEGEQNDKHFNMKAIEEREKEKKKKRRKQGSRREDNSTMQEEDNFEMDVADERFSAVFTSHHFNIDPSDSAFRGTRGTKQLIQEKLRRREKAEVGTDQSSRSTTKRPVELSMLIKSVKKKATREKILRRNV